jgi:hypothetical protein
MRVHATCALLVGLVATACPSSQEEDGPPPGSACASDRDCASKLCIEGTCAGERCHCSSGDDVLFANGAGSCPACATGGWACTGTLCRKQCQTASECPVGYACLSGSCWLDVAIEAPTDPIPVATSVTMRARVAEHRGEDGADDVKIVWRGFTANLGDGSFGSATGREVTQLFDVPTGASGAATVRTSEMEIGLSASIGDANVGFAVATLRFCLPSGYACGSELACCAGMQCIPDDAGPTSACR